MPSGLTNRILGPQYDSAVRNNPIRRNQEPTREEVSERSKYASHARGDLPRNYSPSKPEYLLDAGGALVVLKETTEQEALEPWVNQFL